MIICEGLLGVYITVQIFPKKAKNIFSFKKSHLPALKVFLVIVLGIVHKESSYKDLQSHGMDLRGSSTIHKQISSFLRIPRKSMIKRFRECVKKSSLFYSQILAWVDKPDSSFVRLYGSIFAAILSFETLRDSV